MSLMKRELLRLDFTISSVSSVITGFRSKESWNFIDNWKILYVELRLYVFFISKSSSNSIFIQGMETNHVFVLFRYFDRCKDILILLEIVQRLRIGLVINIFFLEMCITFFQFIQFITCLNFGIGQ